MDDGLSPFQREDIEWIRSRQWSLEPFKIHDAWRRPDDPTGAFQSTPDDEGSWERIPDGWDHEHCYMCGFEISERDPPTNIAYHDGEHAWLCLECHRWILGEAG